MTHLAKSTFTIALITILALSSQATLKAACSGSNSKVNKHSGYSSPRKYCATKKKEYDEENIEEVDTLENAETAPAADDTDTQELSNPPASGNLSDASQYQATTTASPCSHSTSSNPPAENNTGEAEVDNTTPVTHTSMPPNPVAPPTPAVQLKYLVVQEQNPGTGLDLNDKTSPAVNRGIFNTQLAAEETAEIWRDVMPGWEFEVVTVSVNK